MIRPYIISLICFLINTNLVFSQVTEFNLLDNQISIRKMNLINSDDSWSLYKLAPILDSYNQMYLATKNTDYIDRALDLINCTIKTARKSKNISTSQFHDDYLTWINRSHEEKKNDGKEYPLFESYFWRYVTTTLFLIKDKGLIDYYNDNYYSILNFSEENIFNKWKTRGDKNIYRENTNMSALWAHISLNLWLITNNEKYKDVFLNFNENFNKNLIRNENNTFFWNSFFDFKKWTSKGQDVLHANAEVSYFIDCYNNTDYIPDSMIEGFINTLEKVILKSDGKTALYLDGSGDGKGRILDGFMKLGRFDSNLQKKLINMAFISPSEYHTYNQYFSVLLANEIILNSYNE